MSIALYNELVSLTLARDPSFASRLHPMWPCIEPAANALLMFKQLSQREMCVLFGLGKHDRRREFISLIGGAEGLFAEMRKNGDLERFAQDIRFRLKLESVFISSEDTEIYAAFLRAADEIMAGRDSAAKPRAADVGQSAVFNIGGARPSVDKGRPSVALCVSGQYRGHNAKTLHWRNFAFDDCDVDVYVHTWNKTGRRAPALPGHAARVFAKPFSRRFEICLGMASYSELERLYPSLAARISGSSEVKAAQVAAAYGAARNHVLVEDAESDVVRALSNQGKMLYGMAKVYEMAMASGKRYDLMFRLRTDGLARPPLAAPDWRAAAEYLADHPVIVANSGHRVGRRTVEVGDQYAAGSPAAMEHYFRAGPAVAALDVPANSPLCDPGGGFSVLGYNLMRNRIQALGVLSGFPAQSGVKGTPWTALAAQDVISEKEALALIAQDIRARRASVPTDAVLTGMHAS